MSDKKQVEWCGRCSFTTVVDTVNRDKSDDELRQRSIWGQEHIMVDEHELKMAAPHLYLSDKFTTWLDKIGTRLIYGK